MANRKFIITDGGLSKMRFAGPREVCIAAKIEPVRGAQPSAIAKIHCFQLPQAGGRIGGRRLYEPLASNIATAKVIWYAQPYFPSSDDATLILYQDLLTTKSLFLSLR